MTTGDPREWLKVTASVGTGMTETPYMHQNRRQFYELMRLIDHKLRVKAVRVNLTYSFPMM